jgi:hypothetical protein
MAPAPAGRDAAFAAPYVVRPTGSAFHALSRSQAERFGTIAVRRLVE